MHSSTKIRVAAIVKSSFQSLVKSSRFDLAVAAVAKIQALGTGFIA